jgi:hypothetical protein
MSRVLILSPNATAQLDAYLKKTAQWVEQAQDALDEMRTIFQQGLQPMETLSSNVFPAATNSTQATWQAAPPPPPVPPAPPVIPKKAHPLDPLKAKWNRQCDDKNAKGEVCSNCLAEFKLFTDSYDELPEGIKPMMAQLAFATAGINRRV